MVYTTCIRLHPLPCILWYMPRISTLYPVPLPRWLGQHILPNRASSQGWLKHALHMKKTLKTQKSVTRNVFFKPMLWLAEKRVHRAVGGGGRDMDMGAVMQCAHTWSITRPTITLSTGSTLEYRPRNHPFPTLTLPYTPLPNANPHNRFFSLLSWGLVFGGGLHLGGACIWEKNNVFFEVGPYGVQSVQKDPKVGDSDDFEATVEGQTRVWHQRQGSF